jgi:hypothetical protein
MKRVFFFSEERMTMQTFLPYPDFAMSAAVLDNKRLGKQLLENMQIMRALMTGRGWVNHPATLMWHKYEWALLQYHEAIYREWYNHRGFKSHTGTYDAIWDLYEKHKTWTESKVWPYWLGDPTFHRAHQSALLRKDPEYYGPIFGPYVPDDLEMVYPMPENEYRRLLRVIWMPKGEF